MSNKRKSVHIYYMIGVFFLFYFYISYCAPMTGDDWGYALQAQSNSTLYWAIEHYQNWAGRFLSEWYGLLITNHKGLWNLLNAGFFTSILVSLWKLSTKDKKKDILLLLIGIFLILSVNKRLRIQTYTWMIGSTYVIPLVMIFIYIDKLHGWIFHNQLSKYDYLLFVVLNGSIPLFMENAAVLLLVINVLVLFYMLFQDKQKARVACINTIISFIGVLIILLSPGARNRLMMHHIDFSQLSIFQKIARNWIAFLNNTFVYHIALMRTLSISSFLLVIQRWIRNQIGYGQMILLLLGIGFQLIQSYFRLFTNFEIQRNVVVSSVGSFLFVCSLVLICFYLFQDREKKLFGFLILIGALSANGVMLLSPIFSIRSSIYTVFLLFLLTLLIIEEMEIKQPVGKGLVVGVGIVVLLQGIHYIAMYRVVHEVDFIRQQQISYYQDHPEEETIHILGFPNDVVHSAFIPPSDTYHIDTFKSYYQLNEEAHLEFYYLDTYTLESVQKEKDGFVK